MRLLLDSHDEAFVFLFFAERLGFKNGETGEPIRFDTKQLMNYLSFFGSSIYVDIENKELKKAEYDENEDRELDTYSSLAQFLVNVKLSKDDIESYLKLNDDKNYKLYEVQSVKMMNNEDTTELNGVYLTFWNTSSVAEVKDELLLINDAFFNAVLIDSPKLNQVEAVFIENEVLVDIESLMNAIPFLED